MVVLQAYALQTAQPSTTACLPASLCVPQADALATGLHNLFTCLMWIIPAIRQVRRLRTLLRNGSLSRVDYERLVDQQIAFAIGIQEALGIDVLVHGEPEVGLLHVHSAQRGVMMGCACPGVVTNITCHTNRLTRGT